MDENYQREVNQELGDLKMVTEKLVKELKDLKEEYYRNNFPDSQDFQKASRFNTSLKVPTINHFTTPCDVGQIGQDSGKFYICSAVNTWTVAGTQT